MKTIVKYSNRKLYNLNESRYTTLHELIEFAKNGQPFVVIRHDDNEDITNDTLKQCLLNLNINQNVLLNLVANS
jgi:polyhydroxyalkanoate synthesis regulator protein